MTTTTAAEYVIGVDEAGRGCLFGSVDVCAVCILDAATTSDPLFRLRSAPPALNAPGCGGGASPPRGLLRDSKTITDETERRELGEALLCAATEGRMLLAAHRGATSAEIDAEGNILRTVIRLWHAAIDDVLAQLARLDPGAERERRVRVVVDGTQFRPMLLHPDIAVECRPRADATVAAVSAASIIAKNFHDDDVRQLAAQHPHLDAVYGVCANKGYGTAQHMAAIRAHGKTAWHRQLFRVS